MRSGARRWWCQFRIRRGIRMRTMGSAIHVGQDGILRRVGNPPAGRGAHPARPIDNRPQVEQPAPQARVQGRVAHPIMAMVLLFSVFPAQAATFGKVTPLLGGSADIVLDETRNQIYLTSTTQNYVQVYSIAKQTFLTPIPTGSTPLSAAISRSGTNLYVTCYNSQVLDVINLNTLTVTAQINLPAKPEGVAVGSDERVLISTTSSGTANLLMIYNPS